MNNLNKAKSNEKKIFVNFLIFFLLVKKQIGSIVKFFLNVGNQKVTVMFIPHSEKKVFNFRVNLFILYTTIFILLSTGLIISYLVIENSRKTAQYHTANRMTQANERRSREYEEMINKIIENHTIYKTKLNILLSNLNSEAIKTLQENDMYDLNQGGILNRVDMAEMTEFDIEKMEVNKLLNDYQYSIQAFAEINKMSSNYSKLLKDLPFGNPVKSYRYFFTSGFGFRIHPIHKVLDMHQGLDIASQLGTPIVATASGIIEKVDWDPFGYGWYCKVSHKLGYTTLYAHLRSKPIIEPGDRVRKGQLIGYMGRTGATTGVHVHYEVRLGDNLMDPWIFVNTY